MIETIANDEMTVRVKSLGAELCSVVSADGCESIWQGDPDVWAGHSPILFPVIGRMHGDGRYQFDGVEYTMPKHGFARDSEFAVVDRQADSVTFELTDSEATRACWPFRFVLRVRYTLEGNCLQVGFEVCNPDDRTMFFSLGAHPAFACPLEAGAEFGDYYLQFESAELASRWYLENGLVGRCERNFLNNTDRLDLSPELFADDALIFKDLRSDAVTLKRDRSGRSVRVEFAGWPDLGVWSMGRGFVCIEPWFGHDDPIQFEGPFDQKPGIVSLGPEAIFDADYRLCFS